MLSETSAPVPVRIAVIGVRQRGTLYRIGKRSRWQPGYSVCPERAPRSLDEDRWVGVQMRVGV